MDMSIRSELQQSCGFFLATKQQHLHNAPNELLSIKAPKERETQK